MRVIVMFDLPVLTAQERRDYTRFRKHLLKNGFLMMQESIYCKYRGFHSYFYCGIGFILGILIHALFTWRFGMMHYIFFFVAVFEVIYALVQMYRYRSYAPFEGGKTTGKKKICGFDKFTIIFCMLVAIIMIYKMPFY